MANGKGQRANCEPSDDYAFLGNEMLRHSLGFAGREKRKTNDALQSPADDQTRRAEQRQHDAAYQEDR